MKHLLLCLLALTVTAVAGVVGVTDASAQNSRNARRAEKSRTTEQRSAQKQLGDIQDSLNHLRAVDAVEARDFVFEANMLVFKSGDTAHVFSNLNFVSLSGDKATVQVAPLNVGGSNGVGGVTVDGRVSGMETKTDRRGNVRVTMSVMGRGVFARVDILIVKDSNNATVTVSPNLNSNRIVLYGKIVPTEDSRIFKGIAL